LIPSFISSFDLKEHNHKFINLTGNHDIGYSGDLNKRRVERWKEVFGEMNFVDRIDNNGDNNNRTNKFLKLAIINSMNVDGPALDEVMLYIYNKYKYKYKYKLII
jgi:hypothetical protein